ncbi:hypothetical protein BDV93DRAFT_612019 [Ceratobasidium sp. AG-I]|nr:hypothetical protein BDV93DRAFT_612019 [Ceratobasidium sp. AG-I]
MLCLWIPQHSQLFLKNLRRPRSRNDSNTLVNSSDNGFHFSDNSTSTTYPSMYRARADHIEPLYRHSPSITRNSTRIPPSTPSMTLGQILSSTTRSPFGGAVCETRRSSLPYSRGNRAVRPGCC